MKLPNGYGSVYKLSGKRRHPWAARKTVGWENRDGKAVRKVKFIGYYSTRAEAMQALAAYNENPLVQKSYTLADVYALWSERKYEKISPRTVKVYESYFANLSPIHSMDIKKVSLLVVQRFVDTGDISRVPAENAVMLLRQLMDYAVQYDLVPAEQREKLKYVDFSKAKGSKKVERRVFSREEIAGLWESDEPMAKSVLALIFTGLRIGEFLSLRTEDIEGGCIHIRQAKTAAGVRTVPVASRIQPFFPECLPGISYDQFRRRFLRFSPSHTVHDTRHTFISLCADKGIDERVTKALVGHAGSGVTETVYTHVDLSVLRAAVEKVCS